MGSKQSPLEQAEKVIVAGLDNHPTEIGKKLVTVQRKMLKEGMHNGSHGLILKEEIIRKRAAMEANTTHENLTTLINKKLASAEKEAIASKLQYDQSLHELETLYTDDGYLKLSRYHSNDSSGSFSIVAYGLLGCILILADIPLAVQLIQRGFEFPDPPKAAYSIHNLFTINWLEVISHNWEVFLTAIGIAICTVMLKIGYDRYIGTSYGSVYYKKNRFERLFNGRQQLTTPLTEKDIKAIDRLEKIKHITVIAVVVLTIVLLIVLAQFRSHSLDAEKVYAAAAAEIKQADNRYPMLEAKTIREEIITRRDKELAILKQQAGNIYLYTFFGITLMFPVVSGICFSISIAALENNRKINLIKAATTSCQKEMESNKELYGKIAGEFAAWKQEEAFIKDTQWVLNFTNKLYDLYCYGSTIGRMRPDLFQDIPDMLTIIEKYRNKQVLFATNQQLLNLNKNEMEN